MKENISALEKLYPYDLILLIDKKFCRKITVKDITEKKINKEDLHTVMEIVNPGCLCTLYDDKDIFDIEI